MAEIADTPNAEAEAAPAPLTSEPVPLEPVPSELASELTQSGIAGEPTATPRRGRSKLFYILAGVFGTVIVIALLCGGLTATGIFFAWRATSEVQPVLTEFMRNLADEDVDAAYAMMSEDGKKQMSRAALANFVNGPGRQYTYGFKSLTVQSLNRSMVANSNPNIVQGDVTSVQAALRYEDGSSGSLTATLQKIGGRWLIFGAHIERSPVPEQLEKPTTG